MIASVKTVWTIESRQLHAESGQDEWYQTGGDFDDWGSVKFVFDGKSERVGRRKQCYRIIRHIITTDREIIAVKGIQKK
jgi:hypothetical protein